MSLFKNLLNDNKVLLKNKTDQISFNKSIEFKNVNINMMSKSIKFYQIEQKIKNEKIGVMGKQVWENQLL